MPEDYSKSDRVDNANLRELLARALRDADRLQLDFVGIKISEAIDALDAGELTGPGSQH